MRKSIFATLALILCAVSCAPKVPVESVGTIIRQGPIQPKPSAGPALTEALKLAEEAGRHNQEASAKLAASRAELDARNTAMRGLVSEVSRLQQQKSASESELMQLYNSMVEQEKRMNVLVTDLGDVEAALDKERQARTQVASKLTDALFQVAAKDAEVESLRVQLETEKNISASYHGQAKTQEKAAQDVRDSAVKLKASYDELKGADKLKLKLLIGSSAALVASLIGNLLLARLVFRI